MLQKTAAWADGKTMNLFSREKAWTVKPERYLGYW